MTEMQKELVIALIIVSGVFTFVGVGFWVAKSICPAGERDYYRGQWNRCSQLYEELKREKGDVVVQRDGAVKERDEYLRARDQSRKERDDALAGLEEAKKFIDANTAKMLAAYNEVVLLNKELKEMGMERQYVSAKDYNREPLDVAAERGPETWAGHHPMVAVTDRMLSELERSGHVEKPHADMFRDSKAQLSQGETHCKTCGGFGHVIIPGGNKGHCPACSGSGKIAASVNSGTINPSNIGSGQVNSGTLGSGSVKKEEPPKYRAFARVVSDKDTVAAMEECWRACKRAGVPVPKEVDDFFGGKAPIDYKGTEKEINCAALTQNRDGTINVFVSLKDLPPGAESLRVVVPGEPPPQKASEQKQLIHQICPKCVGSGMAHGREYCGKCGGNGIVTEVV